MPGQVRNTDGRVRLSAPRFVGRASARQTVQDALSTPPAVVLVEGEAGIGKSRLVQESLPAAGVLVGGCPPHREPATLAPIVDALRPAGDRLPALRLTPLAGALRPLFPEWAARLPGPPEPLADPKAARYRLFRALAELIEGLDAGVLVVEDLHWADEVSLEFLLFLATRQGSPHQLGLVVTYRPEDLPDGSLVRRLSSRAPAGTTQARVVLPSLSLDHTAELASSMLGGEPVSAPLAALLHEQTGGVPLAVEESMRLLADRADLARQNGSWGRCHPGRLEVPPTVRDATLERAGRLGPAARRVLRAAAVLADPVDEAALVAVAGLPAPVGQAGVAAAVASGLLRETSGRGGGGWLAFRHALVATAVYEAIPVQQRRRLHRRAGRLLETAGRPPAAARQLARHFRAAGDTDRWLRYAELAAAEAAAASDHATAVELLVGLLDHPATPAPAGSGWRTPSGRRLCRSRRSPAISGSRPPRRCGRRSTPPARPPGSGPSCATCSAGC